ncbi:MAG: IPT/TIG domain-containing protein [Candidatus Solibacter sp.]|jgi:uncharacterized protein (TIGR03437 family)
MRLLFALIYLTAVAYAQSSAPVITAATPNPIDAGGNAFTLTVSVSAQASGAVVNWSGQPLATTYVNDSTLAATVPAGLIAICGKYFVTVTQGTAVSNSFAVIVKPVLKSLNPNVVPAGSAGGTVTATGLGFSSNVYLTLNASGSQTNLATTYGGTTTLSAFVPASALNGTYPVSLFVTDPQTGAVSQTLPITIAFASVSAISPIQIYADIASYTALPSFTLAVGGANFVPGSQVLFDTTPLATVYNASNYLTATVPAALVQNAGPNNASNRIVGVSVKNPGAAASNAVSFVILPNPYGTTILSLTPTSALAGGPAVTLTVTGERYVPGSTVMWVQTPLPTTFVSSTQLTAIIPVTLVATEGTAPISVSTPGIANSNSVNFPVLVASPSIATNGISPASAIAGGPAFTMTVNGDGFILASQVIGLDGATTTYVSQNQLTVSVPASAIANVGSHAIQVSNPGGLVSPQAPVFTVKAAATPVITSLSPTSVLPGSPPFTLTVNGSNFLVGATVAWNGAALPTTFVSATQLTAQVPTSLLTTGTAQISVLNIGQVASNAVTFFVSATAASLASLSPSSAAPGGADFILTVAGTGFTIKTTVQWNGAPLATTFVSASQLTAGVPAALIATAGTASVTVTGDGGLSNALPFTIALPVPTTSTAGILNAASSLPAIAPGTLIAIYGSNLAVATAQFSTAPLPVLLGSTSVTINGTSAPLLYVSPGQVNAQVPYETAAGAAKMIVTSNGVSGAAVSFNVAATGPGVFTQQPGTHVLALNLADGTLNASPTPASPGQYVTAYLTGQGAVNPPATTGDVAPSSPPFPVPVAPVVVKIAGQIANVPFAGLAPGFIGLMQMNVQIPDAAPAGEQTFDVSIGGVTAATTVISIAPKQ